MSVTIVTSPTASSCATVQQTDLETTFRRLVGSVFYGQMLKSLRQTVGKPAYLHGGQAEEMFQAQLDQQLAETLSDRLGGPWLDRLFEQFQRQLRPQPPTVEPLSGLDKSTAAGVATPERSAPPTESTAFASVPPLNSPQTVPSLQTVWQEQLFEAASQTQPANQVDGLATGAAALSHLIRK
uniref:Flagellar protein FlgJ N-terminal domain-containing protein n=1 Tax=Schlesneria paludicola TaxID=360056 RepID=A0A7C4QRY2_9PLAN